MTLRLVSAMIPASVLLLLRHWNVQPLRETNATFRLTAASAVRFARTKHCFESGSEESLSRTTSPGLGRSYKRKIRSTKIARREKILFGVCVRSGPLLRTENVYDEKFKVNGADDTPPSPPTNSKGSSMATAHAISRCKSNLQVEIDFGKGGIAGGTACVVGEHAATGHTTHQ